MLLNWDKLQPQRTENIFAALTRVKPSHLLDTELFDFASLGGMTQSTGWLINEQGEETSKTIKEKPLIFFPKQ